MYRGMVDLVVGKQNISCLTAFTPTLLLNFIRGLCHMPSCHAHSSPSILLFSWVSFSSQLSCYFVQECLLL